MKRVPILVAAAAVALAAGACSSEPDLPGWDRTRGSDPVVPSLPSLPALPQPSNAEPAPSARSTEPAPSAEPSDPAPPETPATGVSDRGYLVKQIGEEAGILVPDTGDLIVTLTVTSIEPNFTCTSPDAEPSVYGNYVAFTFDAQANESLAETEAPFFKIEYTYFHLFGTDGTEAIGLSGNGNTCIDASEQPPARLLPGESVTATIVFDVEYTSGIIGWAPETLDGGGWEWHY